MKRTPILKTFFVLFILLSFFPAICLPTEVSKELAQQVAENYLTHYVMTYGTWGGSDYPEIIDCELVEYKHTPVAYNFWVHPAGHLLIPYWDEFSPVLLYSTASDFIPDRVEEACSIESWIIPEIYNTYNIIKDNREKIETKVFYGETRVAKAWEWLGAKARYFSHKAEGHDCKFATVGPLVSTAWDQGSPYNQYCPGISATCSNCQVGCVATAWSQLMKYWNWPDRGTGSHSYTWQGQTLSANFDHEYYWSNMPNQLTVSSSSAQKDAVARLCSDVGIAADMDYGCSASGSSAYANDVLDVYFFYKSSMQKISRGSYTDPQWFNLFKAEFDANPARPVILSVWATTGGGHETVADGYQTGATDKVHINLGWSGSYDGFYDVTHDFTTGSYTWRANTQVIVTNIEPKASTAPPSAPTGVSATDGTYTDKVRVTWSSVSGATSYEVYSSTSSGGSKTYLGSTSSTTYDDTSAAPATTYYYWVKASNSYGTSDYSSYDTGWRKPPMPTSSTGSATSVTSSSATLNGTVNPNGASTTYYFELGTTTSYGSTSLSASAGSGTSTVWVTYYATELSAATTYHFRLVATNSTGTSYGNDASFTTSGTSGGGGGGCFIATAAFGSSIEPHVNVLPEFRDRFLLANTIGRIFVHLYYAYSAPVANFIARHITVRLVVPWRLVHMHGNSAGMLSGKNGFFGEV